MPKILTQQEKIEIKNIITSKKDPIKLAREAGIQVVVHPNGSKRVKRLFSTMALWRAGYRGDSKKRKLDKSTKID